MVCILNLVSAVRIAQYSEENFADQLIDESSEEIWGLFHRYLFPDLNDDEDINNLSQLKATMLKFCFRFHKFVDD